MIDNEDHTIKRVVDLPGLQEIFEALRQGRHICQGDGKIYRQLSDHYNDFISLFRQLGFELKKHRRDFYYFHSPNSMSGQSEKMAVFMFILIESLADQGLAIEDTLMNQQFAYGNLPHLATARYREIMNQLEITNEDALIGIVNSMSRLGFVVGINDASFAFQTPVYRFLDICQDIVQNRKSQERQHPEDIQQ